MPYIPQDDREELTLNSERMPQTAGELNYALTMIAHLYLQVHGTSYATFNTIIGALEACKLELYRRHIAPYENTKIQQNGDVP